MNQQWQKLVEQLREHALGAARFRWWALLAAWCVSLLGWFAIAIQPNIYAAQSRIYVDTRTSLAPVLQGLTINQDIYARLNLVAQSLLGQSQLERLAKEAGLDQNVTTPQEKNALIESIRDSVKLSGVSAGGGTVYTIGYESTDREISLKVVDILLQAFVDDTLGGNTADTKKAQGFLQDQIREYEQRLRDAEQRLADFKRRNVGRMPGAEGDYFTRLQAEIQAVSSLKSQLAIATTRREELQRQLQGGQASQELVTSLVLNNDTVTSAAIKETEARLQALLLRFTDKHPEVMAAREALVVLRERQTQEAEALRRGALLTSGTSTANPVIVKVQQALNDAEVEIAGLRGQLVDRQRAVDELRALVNVVPEVEAEFARLNRDYDVTYGQYNELVARLDMANLGQEAESTESIKFEIIDPPSASFIPVSPNRPLLMGAVLVAGLGLGGGLAFVLHMLKPVFFSSRALQEIGGYPVLGVVSMTWLDRYKRRRLISYSTFLLGIVCLMGVMAIVLLLMPQPLF